MSEPRITYLIEDAIRYATAWSGLDEKLVWQVLEAKSRYLELAGLTDVKKDEVLLEERKAIQHLLPRIHNLLDEGEINYIALMTKLEIGTIQKVMDGDWAYLQSIGVVKNDNGNPPCPLRAPHPERLFHWREVEIPWTDGKFGKLVHVSPKRRPTTITSEEWGVHLLRALLDLHKTEVSYFFGGRQPWVLAEWMTSRQEYLLPKDATTNTWWGWDKLVLTGSFHPALPPEEEAALWKDGVLGRVIHLRDTYSDQDDSADTPGHDFARIFETLKGGRSVLMFGLEKNPSGFIPAVISTLADPGCHIAKVIYPIRQDFRFSQLEIGYIAGFWDAREMARYGSES